MTKIFPLALALAVLAVAGPLAVDFVAGNLAPVTDGIVATMQEAGQ